MLTTTWRLAWAATAVNGAIMLWVARYGALWQPGIVEYLGRMQLWVLRPGMYIIGGATLVAGVWFAWLRYTTAGWVLRGWCDDVRHDLRAGAVPDLGWRAAWRGFGRELWSRRWCALGRHPEDALFYDWEDDITLCEDCGLEVGRGNRAPEQFDLRPDNVVSLWPEMATKPDPLRHLQPDDSCYTQGSDPVVRRED